MRGRVLGYGVAVAMAAIAVVPGGMGAQEDFSWRGAVASGKLLEVRGISGDVRASLASGGTAEVRATKRGRDRDFDLVDVRMFEERDRIVICAIYDRPRADSCDPEDWDDDHDRDRNIRVSVDFEVRVPAGVEFIGRTVSGDVEAEGLRGDVDAATVSGNVMVSTTGVAHGSTVSGDIDVEMGSLDWNRLSFKTVSGDITLRLPSDLDADVDFESLSGDFSTDFDMSIRRKRNRFVGSEVEGTIGSGRNRLSFNTVSGDVRLRRAR